MFSISSNQRRKVLVGLAVPLPYHQEQEHDEEQEIEALDECARLNIAEIFADDNEQPEDIHSYSSNSAIEQVEHVDFEPEMIVCNRSASNKDYAKRKISGHSAQNGNTSQPIKLIKVELNQAKPKNGVETTQRPHIKGTYHQSNIFGSKFKMLEEEFRFPIPKTKRLYTSSNGWPHFSLFQIPQN